MPCSSCFTPVFRGTALLHYSEAAGRRPLFPVGKRQREPICGPIAREEISIHGRSACETTTSRRRRSMRRSHRGRSTAAARVADATICDVVRRSQAGDPDATEALFQYCLPRLTQWARDADAERRPWLPRCGRRRPRRGAPILHPSPVLRASERGRNRRHLRQCVKNRIRDELRQARLRRCSTDLPHKPPGTWSSPFDDAVAGGEAPPIPRRA